MLEILTLIALIYFLIAAVVYNLEVFTNWIGVESPVAAFLLGLAWPCGVAALVTDGINWLRFKLRF